METVRVAQDRYVRLQTRSIRTENPNDSSSASAVRIGCRLLISNFHILEADSITMEPVTTVGPIAEQKFAEVTVKGLSVPKDLIAIESEIAVANLPPIKFAEKISVGELVLNYSNANGTNGFLKVYYVAQAERNGRILLDRPAIPGESGSGLFNLKGELVGIVDANIQIGKDTGVTQPYRFYGTAIVVNVVKNFLKAIEEDTEKLNECKK
ncbi:MAG: hypothetical protein UY51_C0007G0006 [Candidatus Jorgensenbacteria bacterium GW2011_GWB1_49_9]|nr:MAG: hypothetical protein UY51_C0007G0006 [Candidatus Jorgensenbacteria bacterium GW2011_GWB1_49_9]